MSCWVVKLNWLSQKLPHVHRVLLIFLVLVLLGDLVQSLWLCFGWTGSVASTLN
ncbi:hypothetical protein RchiOBHm_Chr2g0133641 [Rosa chinensis]|uniref:Uncharacterized protein n=1 Tax=Rosa chinensis TaxID=74649 RepID=A0A2P6RVM9_ROSCH|nr:hypothetical protein RchiOBHm_Chr2g0133641 [Rosa chinensis]